MTPTWFQAARIAAGAALLALATAPAAAESGRPAASVLIAAAKATPLEKFVVSDQIKGLTIEAWLKQRVGTKGRIVWRSTSCRATVGERDLYNAPICVEAVIRYGNGVAIIVGIGFSGQAPRTAPVADSMWGSLEIKGRGCEFLRHPDYIDAALEGIDETVKTGRCS